MTRTKRGVTMAGHDRHLQRNGGDIKFAPKKGGAGRGNWGSPLNDMLWMGPNGGNLSSSPPSGTGGLKIQTMDEEEFKKMKDSLMGVDDY